MKTGLQIITFFTLVFFLNTTVTAQNTLAKIKYEDAEKAYLAKNYRNSIQLLNEAEKLLGTTAPNIAHLRILARHEMWTNEMPDTFEEWSAFKREVNDYLKHYDIPGLEDKLRDVYDIQQKIKNQLATEITFYEIRGFTAGVKKKYKLAYEAYLKAASLGSTNAQNSLGYIFESGNDYIKKDLAESFKWFSKAANGGNINGKYNLAKAFHFGKGTETNYQKAIQLYDAILDSVGKNKYPYFEVNYFIGLLYKNGQGVPQNYSEAFKRFFISCQDQYKMNLYYFNSALQLADLYYLGYGVDKNFAEAAKWYEAYNAFNRSHSNISVLNVLGYMYSQGGYGLARNYNKSLEFYKLLVKQQKSAAAKVADVYTRMGRYRDAITWYSTAAATDKRMLNNVGDCYEKLNNYREAIRWYTAGAKVDSLFAPYSLALLYYEGKGVKKNYGDAFDWFTQSKYGNAELGTAMMYYKGKGVRRNKDKAIAICQDLHTAKRLTFTVANLKKDVESGGTTRKYYPAFAEDVQNFIAYLEEEHPVFFN